MSVCGKARRSIRDCERTSRLAPGKPAFGALNSHQELRRSLRNEPRDDVARPVPLLNLHNTLLGADWLSDRGGRQIAVPQRIPQYPSFVRENSQPVADPAKLGFQDRVRVAGNQVHDTLRSTTARKIAGTIQRVESRIYYVGSVSNIMQPCRSHQSFAVQR